MALHPTEAAGYINRAGVAICRINDSQTEMEAVAVLRDVTRCVGADAAMFCSLVHDAHAEARYMLACDPGWFFALERMSPMMDMPWIAHASLSSDAVCATQLMAVTPSQRATLDGMKRYGFESTLIVPSPTLGSAARVSVLILGARSRGFFEVSTGTALCVMARSLAMELHRWRLAQARNELIQRAQLTQTDIDLLRHERKGFRTKDIARNLHMTAPAIDSRFQRLNARLGVPSRKAAASLAATYGLV